MTEQAPTLLTGGEPAVLAAIQGDGSTSLSGNGGGYQTDGSAYTLSTIDRHSVCCVADNTSNAAIDDDMTGTLKVGVGYSLGSDIAGPLCARDYKGPCADDIRGGKLICQRKS